MSGRRSANLAGTGRLMRLIVRRDRVRLTLWIGGLVGLMAVSAAEVHALYDTPEAVAAYGATVRGNPALVVFAGPGYGLDHPGIGAVLVNETSLWMALACGLMSIFLVNRHTRAEEESERADLVRSTVVGRHAPIAAVLTVAVAANALVAVGAALTTVAAGFAVAGTVALCASMGIVGVVYASATAVAAQVAGTGRATLGLGSAAAGLAFIVRGLGDISVAALSWSTPFGWGIGVRAYAGERWWTLVGLLAVAVGLALVAVLLSNRRDLGRGMLPQRLGRERAGPWSRTTLGLTFRLQRGAWLGWSVGLFLTAVVYGSVGDEVEQMLQDNPALADYLTAVPGSNLTDLFLSTALRMLAMLVCGYAVSSALRARSEETAGYAESMLATPLSRWWWLGSHVLVTVATVAGLVAVSSLGVGVGYGLATADAGAVGRLTLAGMVLLPSVLVVAGIAVLLVGCAPRLTMASWAVLAVVVVIGIFAEVLRLPRWVRDLSPLEHAPALPAQAWRTLPVVVLTMVAVVATTAGMIGFRRRDLTGG